jgi:hypothetical protein
VLPTKESIEIGRRIGEEIDRLFNTRRDAAEAMGMAETHLSQLISGSLPFGPKNKKRFEKIGGSVVYALTGLRPDADSQKKAIERENEETKILKFLRSVGIDSEYKIKEVINSNMVIAERFNQYNVTPKRSRKGKK